MAEKRQNETEKKQIDAVVGQPVQITLQSMPGSTGYSWFLTKLSGGLALSDTTSVPTATGPVQIAPINQIFSFLAISKGSYEAEFSLIAPWRPSEAHDTEKYQVAIKEPGKTAAEDIESAMKGREFISASAVDVGVPGVIKYAAPMAMTQPVVKYAAPMVCGPTMVPPYAAPVVCGPVMTPPIVVPQAQPIIYAAPMSQAQPIYAAPMDPCFDPKNSMLAANTMIAYAAPVGPSTMAAMDPCFDPKNSMLAASTMIAYAAPVIARDPCFDPRNAALAASTMIAYAAPGGPPAMAAMRMNAPMQQQQYMDPGVAATNILYAAPMVRTRPSVAAYNILYAAPMVRTQAGVAATNILYAAPPTQGAWVCGTQMMPYAAPYTSYGCY